MSDVAEIYNQMPEHEWNRLARDAYHWLEFEVTWHFLSRYLPAHGLILDAGGGPGRYSLELCRQGYEVVLYDLSSGNLALAQKNFQAEPPEVRNRLCECVVGDICDLSRYATGTFDAVLCLGGPITHIASSEGRQQALKELVRVAKPGALVAVAVVGYLAVLRDGMMYWNEEMLTPAYARLVQTGEDFGPTKTIWHFFRADEIRTVAEAAGLHTLDMVGCEGLSTGTKEATNRLAQEPEKWKIWRQVVLETANIPAVVDMAEHILYLGRK